MRDAAGRSLAGGRPRDGRRHRAGRASLEQTIAVRAPATVYKERHERRLRGGRRAQRSRRDGTERDRASEESCACRDGVRGRDDVHRSDDRGDCDPELAAESAISTTGSQWIDQRLPAGARGAVRVRRQACRRARPPADGHHRRRGFAIASACCGFTPKGASRRPGSSVSACRRARPRRSMFPAAVGIVAASFPVSERGRAMAVFFGISGGLTAIGRSRRLSDAVDVALDLLDQHPGRDHRAGVDLALASPRRRSIDAPRLPRNAADHRRDGADRARPAAVERLGMEQCRDLGVHRRRRRAEDRVRRSGSCERTDPLLRLEIFRNRASRSTTRARADVDRVRAVLLLRERLRPGLAARAATKAGLYLLYFFLGYVVASQIGGRILDRRGARPRSCSAARSARSASTCSPASSPTSRSAQQSIYIITRRRRASGLMLTPPAPTPSTVPPSASYSEVTGITQTARNLGASLGLAVLGTILVSRDTINVAGALVKAACHAPPRIASPPRSASVRPSRARTGQPRSSTASSSRSHTPPKPSSTSWPASWPPPSSSRSATTHEDRPQATQARRNRRGDRVPAVAGAREGRWPSAARGLPPAARPDAVRRRGGLPGDVPSGAVRWGTLGGQLHG